MHRNPAISVDVPATDGHRVILVQPGRDPFKGDWAPPGGFVDDGETAEEAAIREMREETKLKVELQDILGVYSAPIRDPRGHTITEAFVARLLGGTPVGSDDAKSAEWREIENIPKGTLGFDHEVILQDLKVWLESKGTFWSTRPRV